MDLKKLFFTVQLSFCLKKIRMAQPNPGEQA
jgi:hypothetical protein